MARNIKATLGMKLSMAACIASVSLVGLERLTAKWIWWHIPALQMMHQSFADNEGNLIVYDNRCYTTLIMPEAAVFGYGSLIALAATSAEAWRQANRHNLDPVPIGWGLWSSLVAAISIGWVAAFAVLAGQFSESSLQAVGFQMGVIVSLGVMLICPTGVSLGIIGCSGRRPFKRLAILGLIINACTFFGTFTYVFSQT